MARKAADETPADAPKEKVTKADAVRAAIAEGIDSPEDGVNFLKERYGIDITRPQFSTYKSQAKSKGKKTGAKRGRKPKSMEAPMTAPTSKPVSKGMPDVAQLIESIKLGVDQMGADQIIRIAEMFRK